MELNSGTSILAEAYIKNPKILYEQVLAEDILTGSITLPLVYPASEKGKVVTIPFIMMDDFGFSLGNTWNTILPEDITQLISTVTTVYNGLTSLLDKKDSQISFQSKLTNIANYQKSSKPKFQVNLMFVCTQRGINPSEIIKTLASMCLPLKFDTSKAQTATGIVDSVATGVSDLAKLGKDVVTDGSKIISGSAIKAKEIWSNTKQSTIKAVDSFKGTPVAKTSANIIRSGITTVKNLSNSTVNSEAGAASQGISSASDSFASITNYVQGNTTNIQGAFGNLSKDFTNGALQALDSLKQMGSKAIDAINESVMMAPLYYQSVYDQKTHNVKGTSGTMTLQIGKWFRASNLICTDISGIKFSKEVIAPPPSWVGYSSGNSIYQTTIDNETWGYPLYASCSVVLEPCTIINYEDFCSYFIQTAKNNVTKADSIMEYGLNKLGISKLANSIGNKLGF